MPSPAQSPEEGQALHPRTANTESTLPQLTQRGHRRPGRIRVVGLASAVVSANGTRLAVQTRVLDGLREHWCGLSVAGPIARTAADAALVLAVLRDEQPTVLDVACAPLRIAVSRRSPVPTSRADAQQRAALDQAVTRLRVLGHEVVDADPPYPATLIQRWSRRWWAGIALDAQRLATQPERLERRTRTMIAKGRRVLRFGGPRPVLAAKWRETATRWLAGYDLLLTPTIATGPARAWAFNGRGYLPTFFGAAKSVPFCQAWNLAGLPAVSVPVGLRDGLPLAVQLVGGPGSELTLLGVAAQIEEVHTPAVQ